VAAAYHVGHTGGVRADLFYQLHFRVAYLQQLTVDAILQKNYKIMELLHKTLRI